MRIPLLILYIIKVKIIIHPNIEKFWFSFNRLHGFSVAGMRFTTGAACVQMKVHEKIKLLRKKSGLSQQEVADRSGLTMSYVSRLENGHHEPSIDVVKKLMQIFSVSADYLLNDEADSYEVRIRDKGLAERMQMVDALPDRKREALAEIIEDMLTSEKLRQMMTEKVEAAVS